MLICYVGIIYENVFNSPTHVLYRSSVKTSKLSLVKLFCLKKKHIIIVYYIWKSYNKLINKTDFSYKCHLPLIPL